MRLISDTSCTRDSDKRPIRQVNRILQRYIPIINTNHYSEVRHRVNPVQQIATSCSISALVSSGCCTSANRNLRLSPSLSLLSSLSLSLSVSRFPSMTIDWRNTRTAAHRRLPLRSSIRIVARGRRWTTMLETRGANSQQVAFKIRIQRM